MKNRYKILTAVLLILAAAFNTYAVTDKEMEEARAITALTYLRYANDLSGYLDDYHPKSMAELQKVLKQKEKENLKTFTAVKTPADYASWDKKQLVEYWAGTFYNSPGLLAKGKIGKSRTRSRLNAMTVGAPAKAADTKKAEETPKAEESKPAEEVKKAEEPKKEEPAQPAENVADGIPAGGESPAAAALSEDVNRIAEQETAVEAAELETEETLKHKNNPTWIYIVILVVLVIIVVWLVIYASNTMKTENRRRRADMAERGELPVSENVAERAGNAAMREKYTESLNQKNAELRKATKELSDLREEYTALQDSLERHKEELKRKDREIARLQQQLSGNAAPKASKPNAAAPISNPAPAVGASDAVQNGTQAKMPTHKTIFLGRVNARGLFVRADKTPNLENSVYQLDTEDGYSGTFRVIKNSQIDARLIAAPAEWLSGGCTGIDLSQPGSGTLVETLSGGTAIFEGGAWKVIRQARIEFR